MIENLQIIESGYYETQAKYQDYFSSINALDNDNKNLAKNRYPFISVCHQIIQEVF